VALKGLGGSGRSRKVCQDTIRSFACRLTTPAWRMRVSRIEEYPTAYRGPLPILSLLYCESFFHCLDSPLRLDFLSILSILPSLLTWSQIFFFFWGPANRRCRARNLTEICHRSPVFTVSRIAAFVSNGKSTHALRSYLPLSVRIDALIHLRQLWVRVWERAQPPREILKGFPGSCARSNSCDESTSRIARRRFAEVARDVIAKVVFVHD